MKTLLTLLGITLLPAICLAQNPVNEGTLPESQAANEAKLKKVQAATLAALETSLWDPDTDTRQAAIYALEAMGPGAKPAIDALAQRMRDTDAYLRADAARTLVEIGPDAIPSMLPLLEDCDPRVRQLAAWSLAEINFNVASGKPSGLH
jgi:HEAT repeat protein